MTLSPAFLDELRARTTLSTVIGRTTPLKKAGREFRACCPFHQEKSPSFYVNDDKGFYHCFGCSAHGDVIRWMTDQRGMPFLDAVRELAAAAGLEMPAQDPRHAERDAEREAMLEVMERAAMWFMDRLDFGDIGAAARGYLQERGVPLWAVPDFRIGWAPGGRSAEPLHRHLKDVAPERLVALGLAKIHSEGDRKGEIFDFFRNRIMFAIRDQRGRVIGFGGRVLGDAQPKYLNSPDTPIFDKGDTLYNVHSAAPAARQTGRLIVVEGYMDVIGLAVAGITEVVAPNGTALTDKQIARMWRLADVPILCFDGDKAGKAAAARAAIRALPLLEPGKSLSFITPPDGQDPDDVARAGGRVAVNAMLANPIALVDVLWAHERDAAPTDTPEQVAGLKSRLREHIRAIRNADVREAYGQDMAKRFRTTFDAEAAPGPRRAPLRTAQPTERRTFNRSNRPSPAARAIGREGLWRQIEQAIVVALIDRPEFVQAEIEFLSTAHFQDADMARVVERLIDVAIERSDLAAALQDLQREITAARSSKLAGAYTGDAAAVEAALISALSKLQRRR